MESLTPNLTDPVVIDLRQPSTENINRAHRDIALQNMLGTDYEYARDQGLIDMFYYNPETGEDALLHTLSGDIIQSENGSKEVAGFHHGPSSAHPDTYVDTKPLEGKNAKALRNYRRFPYEPYNAFVVINGYPKRVLRENDEGKTEFVNAHSTMFPDEYDALTIMQAIRTARDTRDKTIDKPGRKERIVTHGEAPLIDGQNTLPLRLILDKDSEQVITAFPIALRTGVMKLSQTAIKQYLGLDNIK